MFSLTYSSYEAKHSNIKTLCGTKRKTVSWASITITVMFKLFKALPYKKHWHQKRTKKRKNKNPKQCFENLDEWKYSAAYYQLICWIICVEWIAWVRVGESVIYFFEDKLMLPVKHDGTYSIFFLFLYTQGETQISEGISLCPEAVCFPTHYQKDERKVNTVQKIVREFSSLSSNIVDDTQSTVAKDLTWVLVIIPALSLAYLCNLGLNKALWNTICTNRHLKSYFHPYG